MIGPMLMSGLLGQMMTRSASQMASSTPGAACACFIPAKWMPRIPGSVRCLMRYSWKLHIAVAGFDDRGNGLIGHRQDAGFYAESDADGIPRLARKSFAIAASKSVR